MDAGVAVRPRHSQGDQHRVRAQPPDRLCGPDPSDRSPESWRRPFGRSRPGSGESAGGNGCPRHVARRGGSWILGAGAAAVAGTAGGAIWYTGGAATLGGVAATYGAKVTGLISGVEALLRP